LVASLVPAGLGAIQPPAQERLIRLYGEGIFRVFTLQMDRMQIGNVVRGCAEAESGENYYEDKGGFAHSRVSSVMERIQHNQDKPEPDVRRLGECLIFQTYGNQFGLTTDCLMAFGYRYSLKVEKEYRQS
jgi:hypothetical protein